MTKKKKDSLDSIPQLDIKGKDFSHSVPDQYSLHLFIEWKNVNLKRDEVSNVCFFEKEGKELRIVNRNSNSCYIYDLKEVKRVHVLFDGINDKSIDEGGE